MRRSYPLITFVSLCFVFTGSHSSPTVTGNVITWPDDGWYQVQRADNYVSLCEGGRECRVPDGRYIVINHTSGERFTNIIVSGTAVSDTPPVLADNARVLRYPGAGAELFWDRATDDKGVVGYAVTLNGQLLGQFDALSYYLPDLPPGVEYQFSITAFDTADQRSETIFATLGVANTPLPEPAFDPRAPSRISEVVYSSTAAELFWTVPAYERNNPIIHNEILRDEQLLATLPGYDLRSFFDGDRVPGVSHRYTITAIYANGEVASAFFTSAPSPLLPGTPQFDAALPEDIQQTLNQAFVLINADAMEKATAAALQLITPNVPGLTELANELDESGLNRTIRYSCSAGGTLVVFSNVDPLDITGWQANACRLGALSVTGDFVSTDTPTLIGSDFLFLSDFELFDARDNSTISFEAQFSVRLDAPVSVRVNGPLAVKLPQSEYSVESLNVLFGERLLADATLGTTISAGGIDSTYIKGNIRTLLAFNPSETGRPAAGSMLIGPTTVGDLRLDADSGNPDSFLLTVRKDEVSTTYEVPWSERFSITPLDTSTVDFGE